MGSGPVVMRRESGSGGGFVFGCDRLCWRVQIGRQLRVAPGDAPTGETYGIGV